MKTLEISALELHCIAILASYWLDDKSDESFKEEKASAKKIRKFCSELEDDKITIINSELPF